MKDSDRRGTKIWWVIAPGKSMSQARDLEGFPVACFDTSEEAEARVAKSPGCWVEEGYKR